MASKKRIEKAVAATLAPKPNHVHFVVEDDLAKALQDDMSELSQKFGINVTKSDAARRRLRLAYGLPLLPTVV